jgi:pyruvate dehydrogenase complex dehydrogenase (E1) component
VDRVARRLHGSQRTVRAETLLAPLSERARRAGIPVATAIQTPQVNTIPADQEPPYPGDLELERRIKSLVRWNAMAMPCATLSGISPCWQSPDS